MSRLIEIIDPEGERRYVRRRRMVILAVLFSIGLFGYPEAKEYYPKWKAFTAGRKLSLYLSMLKTRAILKKMPLEAKFRLPDLIEVYEVSSCGPNAQHTKLWDIRLSDFEVGVEFTPEP